MKTAHCILTTAAAAALWFACAPFFTASPSFAQPPEKSKTVETREIKIRDGILVKFEAERIDAPDRRLTTGGGYPVYKGKIYIGAFNPPYRILNSGVLEIDGKSVPLDVSSLSDPWVDPKELVSACVRVESGKSESGETWARLKVFFRKGGAEDYWVEWVIQGTLSLRTAIVGAGDSLPDWLKPDPDGDEAEDGKRNK